SSALLEVFRRGGRFDGWSEHFSWERWNEALEAAAIPKARHLREKALDETLPWDVIDASIKKRWLEIEWKKALKEMRTEDCKWGHGSAGGVPGNGAAPVPASPRPSRPVFTAASAEDEARAAELESGRGSAYAEKAKGAAYRQRATPDLMPLSQRHTPRI